MIRAWQPSDPDALAVGDAVVDLSLVDLEGLPVRLFDLIDPSSYRQFFVCLFVFAFVFPGVAPLSWCTPGEIRPEIASY